MVAGILTPLIEKNCKLNGHYSVLTPTKKVVPVLRIEESKEQPTNLYLSNDQLLQSFIASKHNVSPLIGQQCS